MIECTDDLFSFDESSLSSTFLNDEYMEVAQDLALLAVDISDKFSLSGKLVSVFSPFFHFYL